MNNCTLCDSEVIEIINTGPQPISNRFKNNTNEKDFLHPLIAGQCQSCALIQLLNTLNAKSLAPSVDWLTCTEPEDHLDDLVNDIIKIDGINKNSKFCGISFKDDSTLQRLNKLGFNNTYRIDPIKDLGISNPNASVESVQEYLTEENSKKIVKNYGKFDFIISRHILEHAKDIKSFTNSIVNMMHTNGYLYFEIPDCKRALENFDYTTLWEEHFTYFTPVTFKNFFSQMNLKIAYFNKAEYFLEDSYIGIAQQDASSKSLNQINLTDEYSRAVKFSTNFNILKENIYNYLNNLQNDKKKIAIFGAGHISTAFVNILDLSGLIEFVVDDNPHKISKYLPGTSLKIQPSSKLIKENIDLCLLTLAPASELKVRNNNAAYTNNGGHFLSIFPGSEESLLKRLHEKN